MKKLYISALLLMQLPVFGQNIIFQDQNFKNHLLSANSTNEIARNLNNQFGPVDTNGDGEIQLEEALQINLLTFINSSITSTADMRYFTNLIYLTLQNNQLLSYLNLSNLPKLKLLRIYDSWFNQISIDNVPELTGLIFTNHKLPLNDFSHVNIPNLTYLNLVGNDNFPSLDLSNISHFNRLKQLSFSDISIHRQELDLRIFPFIEQLYINSNNLTNLYYEPSPIKTLILSSTSLSSLNLAESPLLVSIDLIGNRYLNQVNLNSNLSLNTINLYDNQLLNNLDLSQNSNLGSLSLEYSNFENINFPQSEKFRYLKLNHTPANFFNISQLQSLTSLELNNVGLPIIDLNSNQLLRNVSIKGDDVNYFKIKNGNPNLSIELNSFISNRNLRYICADQFNFYKVMNNLSQNFYSDVEVNDYCTFFPSGANYNITGKTYLDINNNGYDNDDPIKPYQSINVEINGTNNRYISSYNGQHNIPTTNGITNIIPIAENPTYFNYDPEIISLSFPNTSNEITQNIKMVANGVKNDLDVILIQMSDLILPGEEATFKLLYRNKGNTRQSGTVSLTYDNNVTTFIRDNTYAYPASHNDGILTWNFNDLDPFEKRDILITFRQNRPTDNPGLDNGDLLHYYATVTAGIDETPADNNFTLIRSVNNSFDPNDKTCLEGETISPEKVGEYVHYKIRFENLGSANAKNIVVRDEIDLNKFDISTLVPLDGSHSFFTKIRDTNVAEFIFENIQLPFDDENNDGYVVFKIKTKPNLRLNDTFSNTAKIYFDYNHPIVTNTYTTAVRTLGTDELISTNEAVSIYPNPVKDKVHFQSKEAMLKAEVYDANGRLIFVSPVQNNVLDVKDLPKGNYIIKTYSKKGFATQKMIKN